MCLMDFAAEQQAEAAAETDRRGAERFLRIGIYLDGQDGYIPTGGTDLEIARSRELRLPGLFPMERKGAECGEHLAMP